MKRRTHWLSRWSAFVLMCTVLAGCGKDAQRSFSTPEGAVRALVAAVESGSRAELEAVLGQEMIDSMLDDADGSLRAAFLRAARRQVTIAADPDTPEQAIVCFGARQWPFPAPLVREGDSWRFDGADGAQEVIYRRIGRNELNAISLCFGYVDAQAEYAAADRDGDGIREYASRINSSPGKRDGLYWSTAAGEPMSPAGPFAAAAAFGEQVPGDQPAPAGGYWVRLVAEGDARGAGADPGKRPDFVAWPAEYGFTGLCTFAVDDEGHVYEKDLGSQTQDLVAAMGAFSPDSSWEPVAEEWR